MATATTSTDANTRRVSFADNVPEDSVDAAVSTEIDELQKARMRAKISSGVPTSNKSLNGADNPTNVNVGLEFDRNFTQFLATNNINIVISSYKSGALINIGSTVDEMDNMLKPTFDTIMLNRPLGLKYDSSRGVLWCIQNGYLIRFCDRGEHDTGVPNGKYAKLFYPQLLYTVGDLDGHDICISKSGVPFFISAKYSVLATPSTTANFNVAWSPPWTTKIAGEDRCHLNGACFVDGVPRYVTSCGRTDYRAAWYDNRAGSGVVYDIIEDKVVCSGLTMPHSPRWYQNKLWICNAGTGELGYVDIAAEKFNPVAFLPGYLRGLAFHGNYAFVGTSNDRHELVFADLPLGKMMKEKGLSAPKCAIHVVNMKTYDVETSCTFTNLIEIYDVEVVPGQRSMFMDLASFATMHDIKFNTTV